MILNRNLNSIVSVMRQVSTACMCLLTISAVDGCSPLTAGNLGGRTGHSGTTNPALLSHMERRPG